MPGVCHSEKATFTCCYFQSRQLTPGRVLHCVIHPPSTLNWSGFQTPLCKFPFSVDLLCCVTLHCTAKWFICMFFSIMVYPRILKVVPCALQQDLCYPLCIFFLPPSLSLLSSSLPSLSLPCYARVFSSYSEQGPLFFAVQELLIAVACLMVPKL